MHVQLMSLAQLNWPAPEPVIMSIQLPFQCMHGGLGILGSYGSLIVTELTMMNDPRIHCSTTSPPCLYH